MHLTHESRLGIAYDKVSLHLSSFQQFATFNFCKMPGCAGVKDAGRSGTGDQSLVFDVLTQPLTLFSVLLAQSSPHLHNVNLVVTANSALHSMS